MTCFAICPWWVFLLVGCLGGCGYMIGDWALKKLRNVSNNSLSKFEQANTMLRAEVALWRECADRFQGKYEATLHGDKVPLLEFRTVLARAEASEKENAELREKLEQLRNDVIVHCQGLLAVERRTS